MGALSASLFAVVGLVAFGALQPASAAFPGLNGRIAFTSTPFAIYTMNPDGSNVTRLTTGTDIEREPHWSPDGTQVVYQRTVNGDDEIFRIDADGTGAINLTNHAGDDWSPAWSPSGQRIVFVSNRGEGLQLYVMNADGSNVRQLTFFTELSPGNPAWSPTGKLIAFDVNLNGEIDLAIIRADGSHLRRLTNTPGVADFDPNWAPDGSTFVFASANYETNEFGVWMFGPGGTTQLTSGFDLRPAFAPDGTQIVFVRGFDVWRMNADGTGQVQLTSGNAIDDYTDWQPLP
jgi:TolB protein